MSNDYLLAIDCGTQSVRALIFDLQGHLVDKAQVGIDSYQAPQPGWVENDPGEFWRALSLACQHLWANTSVPKSALRGLVVTTQRATVINLDARGEPLRPAIVWLDQRRADANFWWASGQRVWGSRKASARRHCERRADAILAR